MEKKRVGRAGRSGRFVAESKAKDSTRTVVMKVQAHSGYSVKVDPKAFAERLGVTKRDLAETAGLAPSVLHRKARLGAPATTARLNEMSEIIHRVSGWAGGERQAYAWYRSEPIPAFGDRTAESLVKSGKAAALRNYLDHLALGGFA